MALTGALITQKGSVITLFVLIIDITTHSDKDTHSVLTCSQTVWTFFNRDTINIALREIDRPKQG